jgi:rhodanese-related sulfurtransferase
VSGRSTVHRRLAIIAGLLGALAVAAGEPHSSDVRRGSAGRASATGASDVGVLDVARWLRDRNARMRLVDIRADSQFAAYHIPAAEHVRTEDLGRREWRRDEAVVIYADDDLRAEEASLRLRAFGVEPTHVLGGGVVAWIDSIVEPRLDALAEMATPEEHAARREHLELSRYFGGLPVVSPSPPRSMPASATPHPSRRPEPAAIDRMLRRGC